MSYFSFLSRLRSIAVINTQRHLLTNFKVFWDNAADALLVVSENGRVLNANSIARNLYGMPRVLLGTELFSSLFADPSNIKLPSGDELLEYEALHKKNKTTIFPAEITIRKDNFNEKTCLFIYEPDQFCHGVYL